MYHLERQYSDVQNLLEENNGSSDLESRKQFSAKAFEISSHYDSAIFNYFNQEQELPVFKQSLRDARALRYGENPHQSGTFYGLLEEILEQLNGKELSYNNLVDIDAAVSLIEEFEETAFAILKHTNACGVATGTSVKEAYEKAFAADTVSAFGGVLITNQRVEFRSRGSYAFLIFRGINCA